MDNAPRKSGQCPPPPIRTQGAPHIFTGVTQGPPLEGRPRPHGQHPPAPAGSPALPCSCVNSGAPLRCSTARAYGTRLGTALPLPREQWNVRWGGGCHAPAPAPTSMPPPHPHGARGGGGVAAAHGARGGGGGLRCNGPQHPHNRNIPRRLPFAGEHPHGHSEGRGAPRPAPPAWPAPLPPLTPAAPSGCTPAAPGTRRPVGRGSPASQPRPSPRTS